VGSCGEDDAQRKGVVTYREYLTRRTPPRELAREIVARCVAAGSDGASGDAGVGFGCGDGWRDRREMLSCAQHDYQNRNGVDGEDPRRGFGEREKIDAIYLSPDAFARRTDEASIAEQMGDVFAAAGLPRPVPADDDRVGGWMLMYQMLDAGEWLLTENCIELIRGIPNLVRDAVRIEDVEKMDGDDAADAARYGLKSRYGVGRGRQGRMPLEQRLAARAVSADPTIRAIQARKAQIEETRRVQPVSFRHRRR